jgi:hypothetical protein
MKLPYINRLPLIVKKRFEKSGFPPIAAISGVRRSLTNDETVLPNAAPMTTATARSMTFPLIRNCLKPFKRPPFSTKNCKTCAARGKAGKLQLFEGMNREDVWPSLPLEAWKDTYETLQLWNHWWEVVSYVSTRGLRTSPIPLGHRSFEIEFDFIDHVLSIETSEGDRRAMALAPKSVAEFYAEFMGLLDSLGLYVEINPLPSEIKDPVRFDEDHLHASYDREYAHKFWKILVQTDRILKQFRSEFIGKTSPVHFFWGSFDLATGRFSGRRAPERIGADRITREAYSHEVIAAGFWPGSGNIQNAAFYAYAAPEPAGFAEAQIKPEHAFYNPATHGYVLMYDEVRNAPDPDRMVLEFLRSTYDAGANLAHWNRAELDRQLPDFKTGVKKAA